MVSGAAPHCIHLSGPSEKSTPTQEKFMGWGGVGWNGLSTLELQWDDAWEHGQNQRLDVGVR